MPKEVYFCYIINNCLNIAWLIVFDSEYNIAAVVIIALNGLSLVVALIISHRTIRKSIGEFQKYGMMREVWMVRFMVQNAFAFYCAWISIASLVNLSLVLAYDANLDPSLACTICLVILASEIIVWVSLDLFVIYNYTNYLFSPYCVLPVAIGGILSRNFNPWHHNTIITLLLLLISIIALLTKIVVMLVRHRMWKRQEAEEMNRFINIIYAQQTNRKDTVLEDTIEQDTNEQDTNVEGTIEQDTIEQDAIKQDTGRECSYEQNTNEQDTNRKHAENDDDKDNASHFAKRIFLGHILCQTRLFSKRRIAGSEQLC